MNSSVLEGVSGDNLGGENFEEIGNFTGFLITFRRAYFAVFFA